GSRARPLMRARSWCAVTVELNSIRARRAQSLPRVEQPDVDRARLCRLLGAERLDLRQLERGHVLLRSRPEVEERDPFPPPTGAQPLRRLLVDLSAREHDSVELLGGGRRHEPLLDVGRDHLRGPLERIAPTARAGRLVDEAVAGRDLDEVDLAGQLDLVAVGPEQALARA